jgi:hypothetical protein
MKAILLITLVLVCFFSYSKVPFLFFQQDEILGLGLFVKEGSRIILSGFGSGGITHFVPVTMSISYSIFSLFGLNYFVYNFLSLLLHFINSLLVYALAKRIFKNKLAPFISVLVFISSNAAAELLMWPIINLNVISLTFSLLAWLVVIDDTFLRKLKGYFRIILITILFLLSLFSVEYSAGFALFIPVAYCLLKPGKIKLKLIRLLPFVFTAFAYFLFRIIPIVGSKGLSGVAATSEIPIYFRWIELTPQYFGQLFFGQSIILSISRLVGRIAGPTDGIDFFVEAKAFPLVAFSLGVAVIMISVFIYRRFKEIDRIYAKMFLLTVLVIAFSSLPFLLVPGEAGSFTIFSSRYMYFGLVGLALYLGFINDYFLERKKIKKSILIFGLTALLILWGTIVNYQKGQSLYRTGRLRLEILNFIGDAVPELPQKVVFYTESDRSYYGLSSEERIFPFQSGLGQTLLLFLSEKGKFPSEFYPGFYLWEIKSQGYQEKEGEGFGYFRDFVLMAEKVKEKAIPHQSVFAFRYDSDNRKVDDITTEVRGRLNGYFVGKREIRADRMLLSASTNPEDINLANDGKRETFWDSKLTYNLPQYLEVSLEPETKIAQIQIDSYNNKNQNEVGYKVSLLDNRGNWHCVFYAKRYSPDKNGMVNLYFEPQFARRVKIEQVGSHAYASWVIHELKIYTSVN